MDHLCCGCFGTEECPLEIDGDNIHELLLCLLQKREYSAADSGVGNKDIHAAKMVYCLCDKTVYLLALGNIHRDHMDPAAVPADDLGGFFGSCLRNVRSHHVCPIAGKQHGGGLTNTASGTGDHDCFTGAVKGGNLNRIHEGPSFPYRQRPLSVTMA